MALPSPTDPAPTRPAPARALRVAFGFATAAVAIGLVLLYFGRVPGGFGAVARLARADVLAAGVATYWSTMLCRTWRLGLLLGAQSPGWRSLFYMQSVTGLLGAVSPARAGEAVKVAWLRRAHGVPLGQAALAFGVEKSQDLAVYAVLALVTVGVLGTQEIVPEWLRRPFLPALALLVIVAVVALVAHVRRSAASVRSLPRVLLATACVTVCSFLTCYVVFAMHGVAEVGIAFATFSITLVTGALSMLPGGGQGVVQFAFHHAASNLFGVPEATVVSMVLHVTLCFYLGSTSCCVLASLLRGAPVGEVTTTRS